MTKTNKSNIEILAKELELIFYAPERGMCPMNWRRIATSLLSKLIPEGEVILRYVSIEGIEKFKEHGEYNILGLLRSSLNTPEYSFTIPIKIIIPEEQK